MPSKCHTQSHSKETADANLFTAILSKEPNDPTRSRPLKYGDLILVNNIIYTVYTI